MVHHSAGALPLPHSGDASRHGIPGLTAAWLYEQQPHTRRAYFRDLDAWLQWCADRGLDPMAARPTDVGEYRVDLCSRLTASSAARMMAAASSWHRYLVGNGAAGADRNPFTGVKRPRVDRDESLTAGLTVSEAADLIDAVAAAGGRTTRRNYALIVLLATVGLRIDEALKLDVSSLGYDRGHRIIEYTAKGGKRRKRALDPVAAYAIDTYLADREARDLPAGGPLFATERAGQLRRMDRASVFRLIRKHARTAGIAGADQLSTHSLRHFFATSSLDSGATLHDVQDAMGHADPRTTRRYDRDRYSLDRDPSRLVGRLIAGRRGPVRG